MSELFIMSVVVNISDWIWIHGIESESAKLCDLRVTVLACFCNNPADSLLMLHIWSIYRLSQWPRVRNKEAFLIRFWRPYLNTVDRFLWLLQWVKMVFIVVQWENEDTVSAVNEKQVVGNGELQEGTHVEISTGSNKGRLAIYKATILKVFGKYVS